MSDEYTPLSIKVTGDGTAFGTHIEVNGQPVENVTALKYEVSVDDPIARLTLTVEIPPVEIEGSAEVVTESV